MGESSFALGINMLKEGSWSYLLNSNSHFIEKDSVISKYLLDLSDENWKTVENSFQRKDISKPHWVILTCMVATPFLSVYFVYLVVCMVREHTGCQIKE